MVAGIESGFIINAGKLIPVLFPTSVKRDHSGWVILVGIPGLFFYFFFFLVHCYSTHRRILTGLVWSEIKQLWDVGLQEYVSDMWNVIDFVTNALYVATVALRIVAFYQVSPLEQHSNVWRTRPRKLPPFFSLGSKRNDQKSEFGRSAKRAVGHLGPDAYLRRPLRRCQYIQVRRRQRHQS